MHDPTLLPADLLRELLHYDPETGLFTYRTKPPHRPFNVGDVAGSPDRKGYILIGIRGRSWAAHRLAWIYMTGEHPPCHVDHINGVTDDNRFKNLRLATDSENQQNQKRAKAHSTTGLLGVINDRARGMYMARIKVNGKSVHLGRFKTPEEAHAVYLEAKRRYHSHGTL